MSKQTVPSAEQLTELLADDKAEWAEAVDDIFRAHGEAGVREILRTPASEIAFARIRSAFLFLFMFFSYLFSYVHLHILFIARSILSFSLCLCVVLKEHKICMSWKILVMRLPYL